MSNITQGLTYHVKVRALNFNGYGLFSPISALNACTNPSNILPPDILLISTASVKIHWYEP